MTGPGAIVGVDPGGRSTGIVVRLGRGVVGDELVSDLSVRRPKASPIEDLGAGLDEWRTDVIDAIERALGRAARAAADVEGRAARAAADVEGRPGGRVASELRAGRVVLGVEGIEPPSPHVRRRDGNSLIAPAGLLATAFVLGAICDRWSGLVVVVPPGGNGSRADGTYPESIRPRPSLTRKGPPADQARHARSAWDVASSALWLASAERVARRR